MAINQCTFFWNGEPAEGGGSFVLRPGITPSTATLAFPLRYVPAQTGILTLRTATEVRSFVDCRVIRSEVQQGGGAGRFREVTIEDRRWKWSEGLGAVWGEYNRVSPPLDGDRREADPRTLAAILVAAMGEAATDVSALPSFAAARSLPQDVPLFEPVLWDAANPAAELDQLCQRFGCVPVLSTQDRFEIWQVGTTAQPPVPDSRASDFQETIEPPAIPEAVIFEGGYTLIQHDLPLIPVAQQDGTGDFVHIDELSYKPAGGWEAENPLTMAGVDPKFRKAARRDVWRVYQVDVPPASPVAYLQLPVQPDLAELGTRINGGIADPAAAQMQQDFFRVSRGPAGMQRILPLYEGDDAFVYGFYYRAGATNRNSAPDLNAGNFPITVSECDALLPGIRDYSVSPLRAAPPSTQQGLVYHDPGAVDIDSTNGRVRFREATYFRDSTDGIVPAVIRLRAKCVLRDPASASRVSAQYWFLTQTPNALRVAKLLKNSSVNVTYGEPGSGADAFDNTGVFRAVAQSEIARELRTYGYTIGNTIPYKGFVFNYSPDGVVQSVQWSVAESGEGTSHVDFGIERPEQYLSLNEQRLQRFATYNQQLAVERERKRRYGVTKTRIGV